MSNDFSLTVIVPTIGRPTLKATVASIPKEWRIIVLPDGPKATAKTRVLLHDSRALIVPTELTDQVGHPQRNLGMKIAKTRWLAFLDDDDTYVPNVAEIVGEPSARVPHIFQMRYVNGDVLWRTHEVREGNLGTPMFVVPNDPNRLGRWPSRRSGDWVFLHDTCQLHDSPPVFVERVIALVRPHER